MQIPQLQLRNKGLGEKLCGFSIILILKEIMTFVKSKSQCVLLNKKINFNKNETESKMVSQF